MLRVDARVKLGALALSLDRLRSEGDFGQSWVYDLLCECERTITEAREQWERDYARPTS